METREIGDAGGIGEEIVGSAVFDLARPCRFRERTSAEAPMDFDLTSSTLFQSGRGTSDLTLDNPVFCSLVVDIGGIETEGVPPFCGNDV